MRPRARNEFFQFMKKKHLLLLDDYEIEEIVNLVRKDDFDIERSWDRRVMIYRWINVLFLAIGILITIWWDLAIWILLVSFLAYNLIHGISLWWRARQLYKKPKPKK